MRDNIYLCKKSLPRYSTRHSHHHEINKGDVCTILKRHNNSEFSQIYKGSVHVKSIQTNLIDEYFYTLEEMRDIKLAMIFK